MALDHTAPKSAKNSRGEFVAHSLADQIKALEYEKRQSTSNKARMKNPMALGNSCISLPSPR